MIKVEYRMLKKNGREKVNKKQDENGEAKPNKNAKSKKKYIKWLILLGVVIVIVVVVVSCLNRVQSALSGLTPLSDTTVLKYSELKDSISATGTVESVEKTNVYSTMSYTVKKVIAQVGDYVNVGDVLLELDKASIEKQIKEKELSMESQEDSTGQSLKSARDTYNAYKAGLEEGTNSSIISANSQVNTAWDNYEKAKKAYDDYYTLKKEGNVVSVNTAERTVNAKSEVYNIAKATREAAEAAHLGNTADPVLKAEYDAAVKAEIEAQAEYNNARDSYHDALYLANNNLTDLEKTMNSAYRNYEIALDSLTAAEVAAQNQLKAYKNSVDAARISANNDLSAYQLEEMKKDLEKASITAPVSGTITAVYAVEGGSSTGILFIIEDISSLIVETTVKEYDIASVKTGLKVDIKSDATRDEVFAGTVSLIAPTAKKNSQGVTDTTSDVQFHTEVKVDEKNTPLKIGMSVRLEFIIDKVEEVLSVPYDAVYKNDAGVDCVLLALEQEGGSYLLKEAVVTTGISNDLDIVISGDEIVPGVRVINDPKDYTDGQVIILADLSNMGSTNNFPMMGMQVG